MFKFKPYDELAALWDQYGDHESFYWERGMRRPEPRG
jgi:hypothetical protein